MRPVTALAVLALAMPASACGNGGGDDIDRAGDAVRDYLTGMAEGDGDRSCGRMSDALQERFAARVAEQEPQRGIESCEEAVERVSDLLADEDLARLRAPQVDVTLNRDKATASVEDGPSDITVIKVDGEWLVDSGFAD